MMIRINKIHEVTMGLRQKNSGRVLFNEELKNYTTYRVGGPAAVLCLPVSHEELQEVISTCNNSLVPVFILGSGSNILVHDRGLEKVVIKLDRCCSELHHQNGMLYAGAGNLVSEVVKYCEEHQLAGFDFMSGIPGTVGGALRMNAGAFEGEIGDRVIHIDAMSYQGDFLKISAENAGFGYRRADYLADKILLGCMMKMDPGQRDSLEESRKEYLAKRVAKQPLEYGSCGSVFKRPPGNYAGALIEGAGCKGMQVGGAMVSTKHANFIINYQNASAYDIYNLITQVQKAVYKKYNIWLELEVKLVGFSHEEEKKVQHPDRFVSSVAKSSNG
jgi:UDP-N-acetylmuramate dehydrogenase